MTDRAELLIALSAGGANKELAAHGLGLVHVEELMVRLARKLLREGHRLAFGGALGVPGQPLTEYLIDAALSWLGEESARKADVTDPATWPLVNQSAWPYHTFISAEQRATLVGVCRFVDVNPESVSPSELKPLLDQWRDHPQARLYTSDALSRMRDQSAQESDLRILWGGRIRGAAGWMAGTLEEAAFSLRHGKPILILGGFGGCAKLLADYLADENATWPGDLSLSACADGPRDELLTNDKEKKLKARFDEAQRLLSEFRTRLHANDNLYGISPETFREALGAESVRQSLGIAATAARQCSR